MKNSNKTRLSLNLIFPQVFCVVAISFFVLVSIIDKINDKAEQYELVQNSIFITIFLFILIYSYLMPKVFYNDGNLFVKRYKRKEEIISFKNICSLNVKRFSTFRGISTFVMEYWDSQNFKEQIKFRANYSTNAVLDFIEKLKMINPDIKD